VKESPVSKKQQASVNKYIKEKYDTFRLTFPKGRKAELQAHAATHNESLNGFVNRAIKETVERDMAAGASSVQPVGVAVETVERDGVDTRGKLSEIAQRAKLIRSDPTLRHMPNEHDIAIATEHAELMAMPQYKAIAGVDGDKEDPPLEDQAATETESGATE
jgi:hypothetical protein